MSNRLARPLALLLLLYCGCAAPRRSVDPRSISRPTSPGVTSEVVSPTLLVAHRTEVSAVPETVTAPATLHTIESLAELESLAEAMNPRLLRLAQEASAAEAKTQYADKLPDPTIGANIFGHPIETAAGSQRANMSVMQMIPWLRRLDAQSQQAFFEALSMQQQYEAERLRVVGDTRVLWYRLYVLGRHIETNRANQSLLIPLIEVANARVSTGEAAQGDVLLGTLELSRLEEQVLTLTQQLSSTKAELNRVVGRDTGFPIEVPSKLEIVLPNWTHGMLRQVAWEQQPEIVAAELLTQATLWGLEVAKLKRRPDISLNASWFAIDDNRPASTIIDVGRDAWAIGAQVSIPLWHQKYDAIESEAAWKHSASHASVDDARLRYDSLLRDLWERAKTAHETAQLYETTLLPQARQTLNSDQQSYSNGGVEFDRIVRDVRSVLMLELGYQQAVGELAVAIARIQQAVGTDLDVGSGEAYRLPPPDVLTN
ncbi:MAG: TolC family protein [Planctomycetales bacterium]|nr:TolC family protein [Planctomycetales bacterium]